jgi:hypothetical protein
MNKEIYEVEAMKFAQFDNDMYPFLAAIEELGEFAGKLAKSLRGDKELDYDLLKKEAGDVLWQLNACEHTSYELSNPKIKWCEGMYMVLNSFLNEGFSTATSEFEQFIEDQFDFNPDEVRADNIAKLTDRKNRGKIRGDGDLR